MYSSNSRSTPSKESVSYVEDIPVLYIGGSCLAAPHPPCEIKYISTVCAIQFPVEMVDKYGAAVNVVIDSIIPFPTTARTLSLGTVHYRGVIQDILLHHPCC